MTNALATTRTTTKSDEGEEIVRDGQEKSEERNRRSFAIRKKISREQLIESEDGQTSVELTVLA